jgi:hypothetical protein
MASRLSDTAARLVSASRRGFVNPYTSLQWPEAVDRSHWFTSPELISLHGTPTWEVLSEPQRRHLSFYEAVNFFSLNIHGERALVQGAARVLYQRNFWELAEYVHHLIDEENKHSIWFGTFCRRYAGKVYPDRRLTFPRRYDEGEETFLFFAMSLVFEEIVDRYNVAMGKDERLDPLVRLINTRHHAEEVRHLQFGRQVVAELWERYSPRWSAATIERVRTHMAGYLASTWRAYYNPDVYRDAGLDDPWAVTEEAWSHRATREHRCWGSARAVEFLLRQGILVEAPVW